VAKNLQSQLTANSWVETNEGILSLRHATALRSLDDVNHGDVVVMPLPAAETAFQRDGRVDNIYVIPQPGVSVTIMERRLTKAVGPWNGVVNATAVPASVSLALGVFTPILGLLAIVASAIAVVLVYNVISLTLEERRRERAIVAAVGASQATMIVGPLLEAGVLGAAGGVLGSLLGLVLARPIVATLSHITLGLVGIPITVHASSSTFVTGLVVGIVIGVVAAIPPVRRSMRSDIAAEISGREQRERISKHATVRRGLLYVAVAIVGAVVSWIGTRNGALDSWQPNVALLGFVLAMVGSIMAMGAWAPVAVRGLSRSGRLRRGVARLGIANLVREPGRTGVMAIAIGSAVSVAFITASFNRAIDEDISSSFTTSTYAHSVLVTTVGAGNGYNTDGQIPSTVRTALGQLPGVTRVDSINGELTGYAAGRLVLVESDSQPTLNQAVYDGTATLHKLDQGGALVGANLARDDDLRAGSKLTLDTPTGLASVPIQGVWANGDATGDNVFVSEAEQQQLFGAQEPSAVSLTVAQRASPAVVEAEAEAAHLGPYLKFSTPSKQLSNDDAGIAAQLTPFNVLQRALLLVSFMTEGLAVSIVAVLVGSFFSFGMLAVMLDVFPLLDGYHDTYAPDVASQFIFGVVSIIITLAAAYWPGRTASRTPVLEALTYE